MSPLECNWSTKPIIYTLNNSLAFRYVTSQIQKYYRIFWFVVNERGRIHKHKAPFRKQLSVQSILIFQSMWETCSESAQSLSSGLCFKVLNSWHSLFFCWRLSNSVALLQGAPFWIGGELPVFAVRLCAPNRDARTVTVRYEYMYRATPNKYVSFTVCQLLENPYTTELTKAVCFKVKVKGHSPEPSQSGGICSFCQNCRLLTQ